MSPVIQKVDPLRSGYLAVKHDAVAPQARKHHYPTVTDSAERPVVEESLLLY
jgi:hypothetical protein